LLLVKQQIDRSTTDDILFTFSDIAAERIEKIEIKLDFSNEEKIYAKKSKK